MACLVLGMFAVPIACIFRGLKQQYGLIISMGLFLVYYTMLSLGVTFGESGVLTPVIGLWLPNVTFAIISVVSAQVGGYGTFISVSGFRF